MQKYMYVYSALYVLHLLSPWRGRGGEELVGEGEGEERVHRERREDRHGRHTQTDTHKHTQIHPHTPWISIFTVQIDIQIAGYTHSTQFSRVMTQYNTVDEL